MTDACYQRPNVVKATLGTSLTSGCRWRSHASRRREERGPAIAVCATHAYLNTTQFESQPAAYLTHKKKTPAENEHMSASVPASLNFLRWLQTSVSVCSSISLLHLNSTSFYFWILSFCRSPFVAKESCSSHNKISHENHEKYTITDLLFGLIQIYWLIAMIKKSL